jgi:hypothetical protein
MKLKKTREQPPVAGLPGAHREWWDLGDGYEIYVSIGEDSCGIGIDSKKETFGTPLEKTMTYLVAQYLGVDTELKNITFGTGGARGRDLFLSLGIDCVVLKLHENLKNIWNCYRR